MKRYLTLSLLFLMTAAITSCKKTAKSIPVTGDYLIVGRTGGYTSGAPVPYYMITATELSRDKAVSATPPPTDVSQFHFTEVLSADRFALVKGLQNNVPSELLSKNGQRIGTLAVEDAGYTDIRSSVNGVSYTWYFEEDLSGCSIAVREFVANAGKVFQ